jgi:phosphatidylglycerophosphate synthase
LPPVTAEPAKPGSYKFTDHSLLRGWVTRVWFSRLFRLVPSWMPANIVTLLSTGALASVIVGSLYVGSIGHTWLAVIQLLALQIYVAGDHLDGMQARVSNTMSPLGDFLDHHCDVWAGCALIFGYWSMMGMPLWTMYAMNIVLITGFAITFAERAELKALHFTKWGTLEAIAILSAFYGSWAIPAVRDWWMADLLSGVPRHVLIAATGTTMALGAIVVIAGRLKRLPAPLILNVATLIALSAWCMTAKVLPLWGWLVVSLVGADYVALVMQAYTTTQPRPWPDKVAVAGVLALWIAMALHIVALPILILLTLWLVLRYAMTLRRIISGWSQHWFWINSRAETAP